jgi:hypothetical protein
VRISGAREPDRVLVKHQVVLGPGR